LERLPGIGEKTANRLALYLLRLPSEDLQEFSNHVLNLKSKTKLCRHCMNLSENDLCDICTDTLRDRKIITVIEEILDIVSFETGNIYHGVYHVLHGRIDPMNHLGPDDIKIQELIIRVKKEGRSLNEIILATNPDMEGEATAMYIRNKLNELIESEGFEFKITRLAYGLPIGANLEYADYMTLKKAIDNRNKF